MTLRVAVPNKGRLEQPAADLLRQAGMRYEKTARALSVPVRNTPVELLFVRTEDVCELVADGVAALGITGLDLLTEADAGLDVLVELGFGRCSLTAAVPAGSDITSLEGFAGRRLATSHPNTVHRFFADQGIDVVTVPLRGSVEVAPKLDVADGVVDLVSSGSTLLVNGLRPVAPLLESQAVLAARPDAARAPDVQRVVTMVRSVVAARRKRYVLMNAPRTSLEVIETIIPGLDAPSVVPLAHNDHVAIHSVVDADQVWDVLPKLEEAGASGILVLPIEQMIP